MLWLIIVNWKVSIVSYKLKKDFQVVIYNWITESTRRHLLRNKYTLVARFKKIFLLICELLQASSDSKKKKLTYGISSLISKVGGVLIPFEFIHFMNKFWLLCFRPKCEKYRRHVDKKNKHFIHILIIFLSTIYYHFINDRMMFRIFQFLCNVQVFCWRSQKSVIIAKNHVMIEQWTMLE